jgi:steroid 5-alpha reductase family enzyme
MLQAMLAGLGAGVLLAVATWLASLSRDDVSIVDSAWPWLVCTPAIVAALQWPEHDGRAVLALLLAGAWALRLSMHITARHHGQPEDHRYQAIRARNQPNFRWKSLYLVFGLQALLAWIVATPLMATSLKTAPWHWLDAAGIALFLCGFAFEAIGDAQLERFKADRGNRGRVMDQGLWRYTRHPNYFGECCMWWGLWLMAVPTGAWWTVVSPLLMTVLLLKVSGVTLLEADIGQRRPGYADYIGRTSAFFPWPPRAPRGNGDGQGLRQP